MSLIHSKTPSTRRSACASISEIIACFEAEGWLLTRLAFLVTGDESIAAESVDAARQKTLGSQSPFRDYILQWAKMLTVQIAVTRCARVIGSFQDSHRLRSCSHAEHLEGPTDEKRNVDLLMILQLNPSEIISNLDPLSRAVVVLRLALGCSLQECAYRLNVPIRAVLGANCYAMEWLAAHAAST